MRVASLDSSPIQNLLPARHGELKSTKGHIAVRGALDTEGTRERAEFLSATHPAISGKESHGAEEQGSTEGRGVLRLLESGHFKGVAAVRLQINFFDELSARGQIRAMQAVEGGAQSLIGSVLRDANEWIGALSSEPDQAQSLKDLLTEFGDGIRTAAASATVGGKLDLAGLTDAFNTEFEKLVTGVTNLLAPPAAPVDDTTPPDQISSGDSTPTGDNLAPPASLEPTNVPSDAQEPSSLDAALSALRDSFAAALDEFVNAIDTAGALPTIQPSKGNGVAFQKFLDQLQALRTQGSVVNETA